MTKIKIPEFIINVCKQKKHIFLILFVIVLSFQLTKYFVFKESDYYKIESDIIVVVESLENLYTEGVYHSGDNYNGRMPAYLPFYLPLRMIFNQHQTLTIIVFLQYIIFSVAVVYFAFTTSKFFKRSTLFIILLALFIGLSDYITTWIPSFHGENIAAFSMMFMISFIFRAIELNKTKYYFFAGIFGAWMIFARPFMIAPFFGLLILIIFLNRQRAWKIVLKYSLVFILFFAIIDTIWIARNYIRDKKIIPLQGTLYMGGKPSEAYLNFRKLVASFGGDALEWNPGCEGMWFQTDEFINKHGFVRPPDSVFPEVIFSDEFTIDSLKKMRTELWMSKDMNLNQNDREYYDSVFSSKATCFISNFKKQNPVYYYLKAPMKLTFRFIWQPFTYYQPFTSNNYNNYYAQVLLKSLIYMINAFVIIGGFLVLLYFFIYHSVFKFDVKQMIMQFVPLFLIALFPIYFRFIEYRFLVLAFPFLAFYIVLLIECFISKFVKLKQIYLC